MNPYLKNLNRLEFVVTMACTGRCKHCSQGEHTSAEHIDTALAADAVRKVASRFNMESVMTFGGEPLLYPDTVCAIHETAMQMHIPLRQLITNGFFSKNTDRIRTVAAQLAQSGVNEVLLSVDAFHQETVPIAPVLLFAQAVQAENVNILVHPAWLVSETHDNPYNQKTREILRPFNEMGIPTNEGNVIFPSGNALRYLAAYFDTDRLPDNPYREDPTDIRAVCIGADGMLLGKSIYERDILEILSEYEP
ncbi:MAG: radical SAM protein [Clostridia bacterium]|nr:radical SAM protein [Clostridia bacterium]